MSELSKRVYEAIRPRSMCRDCADHGPRCPNSGELCDPLKKAEELSGLVSELEQQLADQEQGIDNAVKTIVHQGELIDAAEAKLTERDKQIKELEERLGIKK